MQTKGCSRLHETRDHFPFSLLSAKMQPASSNSLLGCTRKTLQIVQCPILDIDEISIQETVQILLSDETSKSGLMPCTLRPQRRFQPLIEGHPAFPEQSECGVKGGTLLSKGLWGSNFPSSSLHESIAASLKTQFGRSSLHQIVVGISP